MSSQRSTKWFGHIFVSSAMIGVFSPSMQHLVAAQFLILFSFELMKIVSLTNGFRIHKNHLNLLKNSLCVVLQRIFQMQSIDVCCRARDGAVT